MIDFPLWVYFALIPSCVAIGFIDYLVFNRWAKCDRCGYQNNLWYHWILPTFIEISLFFLGILIGLKMAGVWE